MAVGFRVDHYIVTKQFKSCGERWDRDGTAQKRLYDDLMHLAPHSTEGVVHFCEPILEGLQGNFAPSTKVGFLCLFVVLVDRKVGQVNKSVLHVGRIQTKLLGAETGKPFPVDKSFEGMEGGDKDVDAHVKFIAIQEKGIGDVLLNYNIVSIVEFCKVAYHFDASSSGLPDWLHDPKVMVTIQKLLFVELHAELGVLLGEVEGEGKKRKGHLDHFSESIQVLIQQVLPRKVLVEGEVVYSLPHQ